MVRVHGVVAYGVVERVPYFLPTELVYLDAGAEEIANVQWTVPADAGSLEWMMHVNVMDASDHILLASRSESAIVVCPAPGCGEAASAAEQYAQQCLDPGLACGGALLSAVPIAGVVFDATGFVDNACGFQRRAAGGDPIGAGISGFFGAVNLWGVATHVAEASVLGTAPGVFADVVDTPAQLVVGGVECTEGYVYEHLQSSGGYSGWITRAWQGLEHIGGLRSEGDWGWVDSCSVALIVGDVIPRLEADTLRSVPDTTNLYGSYIVHKNPGMSWVFAGLDSVLAYHGHILKLRGLSDSTFALGLSHRRPDGTRERVDFGSVREVPGAAYCLALCDTTTRYLLLVDWEGDGSVDTTFVGAVGGLASVSHELFPVTSRHPRVMALHAAQPNPSSMRTEILFDLPHGGATSLAVFDVAGRRVVTLIDHEQMASGSHDAVLRTDRLRAGTYFVRLEFGSQRATRKLQVIR